MKKIPLIILGCGGVGQQLITHILETRNLHAAQGIHIAVAAISDSRSLVVSKSTSVSELHNVALEMVCLKKGSNVPLSSLATEGELAVDVLQGNAKNAGLLKILQAFSNTTGFVVADCTASEDTVHFLAEILDMGGCIVLANKKPLTSDMELSDRITSRRRRLRYESTVGAGLPIITSLTRFLISGDPVHCIMGALSGTLGYVMSGLQEGQSLSSVVRLAKSLGYTEPDPRDDLSGTDVARKALILARSLGWQLELKDVEVESLFPSDVGPEKMSVESFLAEGLSTLDMMMDNRVRSAASRGCVLRYVAIIKEKRCKVGIVELPNNTPLGRLRGSDNLVEIYSRCYQATPFVIQGAGAGNDTTAAGVLADILDLQDLF